MRKQKIYKNLDKLMYSQEDNLNSEDNKIEKSKVKNGKSQAVHGKSVEKFSKFCAKSNSSFL